MALQPLGVANQQLPCAERPAGSARVEAQPAERFGEHRPPEQGAEREQRKGSRRRKRSQRDQAATAGVGRQEAFERFARRILFDPSLGWLRFRVRPRLDLDPLARWDERLVEGAVHVDRTGRRAEGGVDRTQTGVAPRGRVGCRRGQGRFEVGPRVAAVEVGLLDGLVRAGVAAAGQP